MENIYKLFTVWVLLCIFCSLLSVKLEGKSNINWFAVFLPLWIFNVILFYFSIVKFLRTMRPFSPLQSSGPLSTFCIHSLNGRLAEPICVILMCASECLLCIKLQYFSSMSLFFVMIPFWILMIVICAHLGRQLFGSIHSF